MYLQMAENDVEKRPNKKHLKIFTTTFKYINRKHFEY